MTDQSRLHWLPRLLAVWTVPALVTFGAMLTHHSDNPAVLGRYSPLVAAMLGGLLLLSAALVVAALALRGRSALLDRLDAALVRLRGRAWFAPAVLIAAGALLAGLTLFFLGDHLLTYGLLRLFLGATVALGALALLFGGKADSVPARWVPLALAGIMVLLGVALISLDFYPAMYRTDEAFIFSMARHLAESGHNGPTIYRHAIPQDYGAGGLWTWMMAVWLRLGGMSFTAGRLFSFLIGLAALGFTVAAARRAYGPAAGWFAAVVGLFAFTLLRYIRNDMPCALFLALALMFYCLGQARRGWWPHLLAGLAAGLCVDAAPIGYCFGLGFALVYLSEYVGHIRRDRQWFWPPFWALALGGALALGAYFLVRAGSTYVESTGGSIGGMASNYLGSIGAALASGQYLDLIRQVFTTWLTNQPILFGLAALGVGIALRERTALDRLLLVLLAAWMAVIVFTYHYFPVLYLVHGLPVALLLAGRGVSAGLPWLLRSAPVQWNALGRAAAVLLIVWLLAAVARQIASLSSLEDVVQAGREIAALTPQGAVIVAAEPYYFGMLDHTNFVGGAVEGMIVQWQGHTPEEAWEIVAPDAVIFSQNWPEPPRTPGLLAYLDARGMVPTACWQTDSYGRVELWTAGGPGLSPDEACRAVCVARWGRCAGAP